MSVLFCSFRVSSRLVSSDEQATAKSATRAKMKIGFFMALGVFKNSTKES